MRLCKGFQGVGIVGSKSMCNREHGTKTTREQRKVIQGAGSRRFWALYQRISHNSSILGFFIALLRSAYFLTPVLLSTTSKSHILTCLHFLVFHSFREQMKGIPGSGEVVKIIQGANKVNLGSSDKENLGSGEQSAKFWRERGAEDPPPPCRASDNKTNILKRLSERARIM